jgi:hypothetical protein
MYICMYRVIHKSLQSDLCSTVARMVMPKQSMSTEGETIQVSVLPYRCLICPFCCVCLGCCVAEFRSSRGTYELPCVCVCVCVCVYIYIYRERERERVNIVLDNEHVEVLRKVKW